MKKIFIVMLCFSSLTAFAERKLLEKCTNVDEGIEVFLSERIDEGGNHIQTHSENRYLYNVEIKIDSKTIYSSDEVLFSKENNEYYSNIAFSLSLNFRDNARLYLSYRDRFGVFIAPPYNTVRLDCLSLSN